MTSLVAQMVKNLPAMRETLVQSLGQEDSRGRERQPTPVFLPGEFHGQRSLVDYSPWGLRESDTTERLTLLLSCLYTFTCIYVYILKNESQQNTPMSSLR